MSVATPTYDPQDALNLLKPQLSNVVLDTTAQGHLCNQAHLYLWNYATWRWTKKALTDITLVDGQIDYTGSSVPTDFLTLLQASCVRTDTTPDEVYELEIKSYLAEDYSVKSFPIRLVSFQHELNSRAGGFRVLPNPSISSGVTAVLRGVYKATPATTYTSANLTTNFSELPDVYFGVFCEVLLWHIYRYVGDARAGAAAAASNNRATYTGQLATMMDALNKMLEAEDIGDTDTIFPAEPLGYFRRYGSHSGYILP